MTSPVSYLDRLERHALAVLVEEARERATAIAAAKVASTARVMADTDAAGDRATREAARAWDVVEREAQAEAELDDSDEMPARFDLGGQG